MNTEPRWCSSMRRSGAQPADGVYYVRGDVTNEQDLRRAGIPEGSELYRVALPDDYCGLSVDDLSARPRADHRATLLAISREGAAHVNPDADFRLEPGDDAVVVAESLGTLAPLRLQHTLAHD